MATDPFYSPETLPHFESGDLEQGLQVARQLLEESRRGTDQERVLHFLEEVARFAIRLGQFDLGIDARQEMLARHTMLARDQPSLQVTIELSRLGYYYRAAKRFDRAEEYLLRALRSAELLPEKPYTELSTIYINRCHVSWDQGDLKQAHAHLLESWRLNQRQMPYTGENDYALLQNYANLLRELGDGPKSQKMCRLYIQSNDTPDLPRHSYSNLAGVYFTQGRLYEDASQWDLAFRSLARAEELVQQAPRRWPIDERNAAEKISAALARVRKQLAELA